MAIINLLYVWVLSAFILYATAFLVPGFKIHSFGRAMIASVVVGLFNATIWWVLFILTIPLTVLTLGLFVFVVNAIVLRIAAGLMSGFEIKGWLPAILGAFIIAIFQVLFKSLFTFQFTA